MRVSRMGILVSVLLASCSIVVACAESAEDPVGVDDGVEPGGRDGSTIDRPLPRQDASAADAGEWDAQPDAQPDAKADAEAGIKDAGKDVAVDAPAPVDAGPTTRLFFLGDFAVNNTSGLGRAAVPVGASVPATSTIAAKASTFAVTPDGTKIVFASEATPAGRTDLFVANSDGSSAAARVVLPNVTGTITDIAISPDGATIAYIADAEVEGENNVYLVQLAGASAPVRVSPRTAANDKLDAQSIGWSRDSVYLAMVGDFTVEKKNELYIVDTTAAVPAPVAVVGEAALPTLANTVTIGVSSALRPAWTADGKVCVKGDLVGTPVTLRLHCSKPDGSELATPASFPALPAQLGAYGLSADGMKLAFSVDSAASPGAYEIYVMPSDGSAAPTRVTSGTITAAASTSRGPSTSSPLLFSPDGANIAFIADIAVYNRFELYVVSASGASTEKRVAVVGPAGDANRDVQAFVWSPDSSALAFVADHRKDNDFELFRVLDVTTADQVPRLVRAVVDKGDITELDWRP